jgi:hypothetical protein
LGVDDATVSGQPRAIIALKEEVSDEDLARAKKKIVRQKFAINAGLLTVK